MKDVRLLTKAPCFHPFSDRDRQAVKQELLVIASRWVANQHTSTTELVLFRFCVLLVLRRIVVLERVMQAVQAEASCECARPEPFALVVLQTIEPMPELSKSYNQCRSSLCVLLLTDRIYDPHPKGRGSPPSPPSSVSLILQSHFMFHANFQNLHRV